MNLEELFIEAAESTSEEILGKLLETLKKQGSIDTDEIAAHISYNFV